MPATDHDEPTSSEETSDAPPTQQERLITVLYSLEEQIGRQTSLRFAFLRGAVYGLGTVIGATLLLALFGGILAATISSLSELPFIGSFVDSGVAESLSQPDADTP
ncbi:MAG: DUF5665 domain-containing protein [Patescibacteria group bacterium]